MILLTSKKENKKYLASILGNTLDLEKRAEAEDPIDQIIYETRV